MLHLFCINRNLLGQWLKCLEGELLSGREERKIKWICSLSVGSRLMGTPGQPLMDARSRDNFDENNHRGYLGEHNGLIHRKNK